MVSLVVFHLNFVIKIYSFIGIVGQTGAGKTTIIKLLLRFYDPISGQVKIGNYVLNSHKLIVKSNYNSNN